mmetsp:Transcript_30353/g.66725  ORF Transcript_30353/g.66725 Transcript_30353/m.66725 type:complete len:218 (+) Transcript_30353:279-932(+)
MTITHLTQKRLVEKKSLNDGTKDGDHGKTAVHNLLGLGLLDKGGILTIKSVRAEANVTRLALAVVLVEVGKLDDTNGEKDLEVSDKTDGADGLDGIPSSELITGKVGAVLLPDHTDDGKHGGTAVFELCPASVLKVGLDLRKAHGVKAHVTSHGSIKLLRTGKEGNRLRHLSVDCNCSGTLGRPGGRREGSGGSHHGGEAGSLKNHGYLVAAINSRK